MKHKILVLMIALIAAMSFIACEQSEDGKADKDASAKAESKEAETKPVADQPNTAPAIAELSGSHILISYKGAPNAKADNPYNKEEAKKFAEGLIKQLKADPGKFEELARQYSTCPSANGGGDLGTWNKGQMVPAFDDAVEKLKVGEITEQPVETPFGFHVIRRNKGLEKIEISAEQIMIQYKEALTADQNGVTRSKDEASKLAEQVVKEAKADPDKFQEIAKKYNDAPSSKLPIWTTGTRMPKVFDLAVMPLKVGEVSDAVESPFGFHIFKRIEVVHLPKRSGSHIMISYKDARMAPPTVTRTKEEAKKLALEVLEIAKNNPEQFRDIALKRSEDPSVTLNGGSLGVWEEGEMLPQFEEVFSKLKVGEVGGPVESISGIHILKREEVTEENK